MSNHSSALALLTVFLLGGPAGTPLANAADYRLSPATNRTLSGTRPGAFFLGPESTYDYNSYSYDDRYHGPAPYYGTRYYFAPYAYAPGYPMYRYSTGGALYYWPR